jgi:hypothetical protein
VRRDGGDGGRIRGICRLLTVSALCWFRRFLT